MEHFYGENDTVKRNVLYFYRQINAHVNRALDVMRDMKMSRSDPTVFISPVLCDEVRRKLRGVEFTLSTAINELERQLKQHEIDKIGLPKYWRFGDDGSIIELRGQEAYDMLAKELGKEEAPEEEEDDEDELHEEGEFEAADRAYKGAESDADYYSKPEDERQPYLMGVNYSN